MGDLKHKAEEGLASAKEKLGEKTDDPDLKAEGREGEVRGRVQAGRRQDEGRLRQVKAPRAEE